MALLVPRALSLRISGCGFRQHCYSVGSGRILWVANGHGNRIVVAAAAAGSELEMERVGALNEVAPPVSSIEFGTGKKQATLLEDPAGFLRNRVDMKLKKVRQAFQSVEEAVSPSPYAPSQGDDVVIFLFISVFFIFIFWFGNYVAPTWIFRDTVFRNPNGNMDDDEFVPNKPREDEVDPADSIELPPNLQAFRGFAVDGFKAGRQRARDEAEARRKKKRK